MSAAQRKRLDSIIRLVFWIFLLTGIYSLVAWSAPVVAWYGTLFLFGIAANAAVVPSALLLVALIGLRNLIAHQPNKVVGWLLLVASGGVTIFSLYLTMSPIVEAGIRSAYVSRLPTRTLSPSKNRRIVKIEEGLTAKC